MHTRPTSSIASAVTALFVPGDRPDRFARAIGSGADLTILDLEDAVAEDAKAPALDAVLGELQGDGAPVLVRIADPEQPEGRHELDALADAPHDRLAGVMLPKAETQTRVEAVHDRLGVEVIALVETAAGLSALPHLTRARGLARIAFGAIDFALDIGADGERALDYARSRIVVASRTAGLPAPLDSPSPSIRDLAVVETAARRARSFGFGGQLCIHPAQVDVVRGAFRPAADEVAWAKRVLAVDAGAAQVDGTMVDRPVIERARRVIARAGQGEAIRG